MPGEHTGNPTVKAVVETLRDMIDALEISQDAKGSVIDLLTETRWMLWATVDDITWSPKEKRHAVSVQSFERRTDKHGRYYDVLESREVFMFPPNDQEALAELKRAQDHGSELSLTARKILDVNHIQDLRVRSAPYVPEPPVDVYDR